jgi:hypothetical protein
MDFGFMGIVYLGAIEISGGFATVAGWLRLLVE